MKTLYQKHPASFRDPSGFIFRHDSLFYRQVNESYKKDFNQFIESGLYSSLTEQQRLIPHKQLETNITGDTHWYTTLLPDQLPFVSYYYEWPFDMLKEAALTTLQVASEALNKNMILKDASAFNIQLYNGRMMLIDSLSFETYEEHLPWVAYRQFCEHFLAPLAFMHYSKAPVHPLLNGKIEGLPLDFVQKLLPFKSKFNLHHYLHLHLQASLRINKKAGNKQVHFTSAKMKQLLSSLQSAVQSCKFSEPNTVWSEYYQEADQRDDYLKNKKEIVLGWIEKLSLASVLDVGTNTGEFSEITAAKNIYTISIDADHHAVNKLYNRVRSTNNKSLHPLVVDITNPSPAIGWNNEERASFLDRIDTDLVLALAVIHHLVIAKNIALTQVASLFSKLGSKLIIEFVPKKDEKVQFMLSQRKDIFDDYTEEKFLAIFSEKFKILDKQKIADSERVLYLMDRK